MGICSQLSVAQNPTNDRLVAYFAFDKDTLNDDSGNANAGTPINVNMQQPGAYRECGVLGTSIHFNGDDDAVLFIGTISADAFTLADFSISFYFKPKPVPGTQLIMRKQEDCSPNKAFWVTYSNSTRSITSGISQHDSLAVSVSSKLDEESCWHHVVLSRKNTLYSLYLNGTLRDTATSATRIDLSSTELFRLGEPLCPTHKFFNGEMDELRIYNKALTKEEIDGLYFRPDQIINKDTVIYLGNSFNIATTNSCAMDFMWMPDNGVSDATIAEPLITPNVTTTYYLFSKLTGCVATDSISVRVIDPDTLDCSKIFLPNAFSPGASPNLNDLYGISNPFAVDEFESFEIFDRWGGRVFHGEDAHSTWDGTFNGAPVNPGVYLYRLRYKCDGEEKIKAGSLVLVR